VLERAVDAPREPRRLGLLGGPFSPDGSSGTSTGGSGRLRAPSTIALRATV
jgi:hypothetical protein